MYGLTENLTVKNSSLAVPSAQMTEEEAERQWNEIASAAGDPSKLDLKDVQQWVIAKVKADYSFGSDYSYNNAQLTNELEESRLHRIFSKIGNPYVRKYSFMKNSDTLKSLSSWAATIYSDMIYDSEFYYGAAPPNYITREGYKAYMGWWPKGHIYDDNGAMFSNFCNAANVNSAIDFMDINKRMDEFLKAGFGEGYDGINLNREHVAVLKDKLGPSFEYETDKKIYKNDYIFSVLNNMQKNYAANHGTKIDGLVTQDEYDEAPKKTRYDDSDDRGINLF